MFIIKFLKHFNFLSAKSLPIKKSRKAEDLKTDDDLEKRIVRKSPVSIHFKEKATEHFLLDLKTTS